MVPKFEVHLEEFNHALHIDGKGHKSDVSWLDDLLYKNNINPRYYVLKDWVDENPKNLISILYKEKNKCFRTWGSHGVHHYYDEKADRSPYFNQEGLPGLCGGFFFRLLPLWIIKSEIKRVGIFYIHPHDLDESHPILKNPFMNWKRHVGLKGSKKKLERLLGEVQFA